MFSDPPLLTHRTLPADDGEPLHYYTGGRPAVDSGATPTAPTLVFLHGLGSNHTRYHRLLRQPFFQERCRLIVLDLRGHGASHARRNITAEGIGRDLCRLLEHERARRTILVGHCLGANLAVSGWERCAERIGGLIFIEPFVVSALRRELRALYASARPFFWLVCMAMRGINALGIKRTHFRAIDYEVYDEWVRARLTSFWAAVRWMGPWIDLQTMPVISYLQAFTILFAYRPPWEAIACPVLAIYGKKAGLAEEGGSPLPTPHAQTRRIEASHFVLTDNMPAVAEAIEAFVQARANG